MEFSRSGYVGGSSHSHTPVETPASATYHFPPSKACSWRSASYSQLGGERPLFSASLGICKKKNRNANDDILKHTTRLFKLPFPITNFVTNQAHKQINLVG